MLELIELSNHANDIINSEQRQMRIRYETLFARYLLDCQKHAKKAQDLKQAAQQAKAQSHYPEWVYKQLQLLFHQLSPVHNKQKPLTDKKRQALWQVDRQAPDLVTAILFNKLGNEWGLVSGYENANGSISQILIGPENLTCIECLDIDGELNYSDGRWYYKPLNANGQVIEGNRPVLDHKGQAFGYQLKAVSKTLTTYLNKEIDETVNTTFWLILTHPNARIGELDNPPVGAVMTLAELYELTAEQIDQYSAVHEAQAGQVFKFIQKHHRNLQQLEKSA